jgi:hypothetical protein
MAAYSAANKDYDIKPNNNFEECNCGSEKYTLLPGVYNSFKNFYHIYRRFTYYKTYEENNKKNIEVIDFLPVLELREGEDLSEMIFDICYPKNIEVKDNKVSYTYTTEPSINNLIETLENSNYYVRNQQTLGDFNNKNRLKSQIVSKYDIKLNLESNLKVESCKFNIAKTTKNNREYSEKIIYNYCNSNGYIISDNDLYSKTLLKMLLGDDSILNRDISKSKYGDSKRFSANKTEYIEINQHSINNKSLVSDFYSNTSDAKRVSGYLEIVTDRYPKIEINDSFNDFDYIIIDN